MKPFNIEEAKAGKPVCTKSGIPVRIICWDRGDPGETPFPIVALVKSNDILETIEAYTIKGKWWGATSNRDNKFNLMMAPETKKGWINIYETEKAQYPSSIIYKTEEEALQCKSKDNYITTIEINWKE